MINIGQMRAAHVRFVRAFERTVDSAADQAAQYTETNAKQRLTVHNRTGRLMRSTSGRVVRLPDERRVRLENHAMARGVGYASFVDQGTSPHDITPNSPRKFLRFKWRGRVWFMLRVWHPGTKAYLPFTKARRSGYLFAGHLLRTQLAALARSF